MSFNKYLAKSIISKNAVRNAAKPILADDSSAGKLSDEDYKRLRKEVDKKSGFASSIIRKGCEKEPFIISMLFHCIKAYTSRADTPSEDRETLAYSVTLSALTRVLKDNSNNEFDNIAICLLHWFDRPAEESPKKSTGAVFSKWIFVFLNFLIREAAKNNKITNLIAPTCQVLESHKNDRNFDENIYIIAVSRLFATRKERNVIYGERFFELNQLNSYAIKFWFKTREARYADGLFEGMLFLLALGMSLALLYLND